MKALGLISVAVLAVILLAFLFAGWGQVPAGHRGVLLHWSAAMGEPLSEGFYFKNPIADRVVDLNVQTQKVEEPCESASKDLQDVRAVIAVNYNILPASAVDVYRGIGLLYVDTVLKPIILETSKAVTAQFTAEELIGKREEVRNKMLTMLTSKFPTSMTITGLNIVDFKFSASFTQAIERKVVQEQDTLTAKNKLDQVGYEAQQLKAAAEGKAEAMKVEAAALKANLDIVQIRALEKWNGVLPQVCGGAVPFINLEKK